MTESTVCSCKDNALAQTKKKAFYDELNVKWNEMLVQCAKVIRL